MAKTPTLRGYVHDGQIYVFCPYCDCWHVHGYVELKGHRSAHCSSGPFKETGYYVTPYKKKDLDKIKGISDSTEQVDDLDSMTSCCECYGEGITTYANKIERCTCCHGTGEITKRAERIFDLEEMLQGIGDGIDGDELIVIAAINELAELKM